MKPRVLFLDDEEPMRILFSDYFQQNGCEVATAATGLAALELAKQSPFDVAVFDIRIAGENGLETLSHFKSCFPKLPIIMFTGMADSDDLVEQARLRGASGFMRKSDPLQDLFDAVKLYMPPP